MREMKDSGIEFIGMIPKTWTTVRMKTLGKVRNGLTYSPNDVCDESEGVLVLRSSNIKNGKINLNDNIYVSCKINNDLMVRDGDILICSRNGSSDLIGKNAVVSGLTATFGAFMMIFRCNEPNYLYYILNSPVFSYYLGSFFTTTINQLTGYNFGNMKVAISFDSNEQQKIATYLDEKCEEIDALISELQQQIEVLKEYKRSVITETVTKGLNSNVKMKDSGVQWIGEIPEHWSVHPLYCYFGERKNKNIFGNETNLLSLSYGKIIRKDINANGGLLPDSFNTYNIIEENDIIIRPTDLQNDKRSLRTGIAREHGIITSAYIALKPIVSLNPEYFHYLLYSYDIMKVFYNMGNGVRQGLNFSEFSRLMVFEPTMKEQNDIVDYLKEKCHEIDVVVLEKKKQIKTIEEYKKSLIFEYVTGKKEVSTSTITINPVILMAYIMSLSNGKLKGKVHLQKIVYLCDYHLNFSFGVEYIRQKKGPYDEKIDDYLELINSREWFNVDIHGNPMTVTLGTHFSDYKNNYMNLMSVYQEKIQHILDFTLPMNTSEAERVATFYASWNDLLIDGIVNPTFDDIYYDVINNWTPNKGNYKKETWKDTYDKMIKVGIIPNGKGTHTKK